VWVGNGFLLMGKLPTCCLGRRTNQNEACLVSVPRARATERRAVHTSCQGPDISIEQRRNFSQGSLPHIGWPEKRGHPHLDLFSKRREGDRGRLAEEDGKDGLDAWEDSRDTLTKRGPVHSTEHASGLPKEVAMSMGHWLKSLTSLRLWGGLTPSFAR